MGDQIGGSSLPFGAGFRIQLALNAADRDRQFPFLERCPVAKCAGFAGQNGHVMQRIVDGMVAPEDALMTTDNLPVLPAFQPIRFELRTRHEEPPPDYADLVLELTLLPARCRGAGDRLDEVVPAHLAEPAVVGLIFADEDRVHRCLDVIVDAPGASADEKRKRLVVGIEHHLLSLAWVGSHERHPAMTEPEMGDLDRRRHAIDQNDLMAPVELIGFAGIEAQRHIGVGGRF